MNNLAIGIPFTSADVPFLMQNLTALSFQEGINEVGEIYLCDNGGHPAIKDVNFINLLTMLKLKGLNIRYEHLTWNTNTLVNVRNHIIKELSGYEYFLFVDADMVFPSAQTLKTGYNALTSNPDVGFLSGSINDIDDTCYSKQDPNHGRWNFEPGNYPQEIKVATSNEVYNSYQDIIQVPCTYIALGLCMVTSKALKDINYFDDYIEEFPTSSYLEELYLALSLQRKGYAGLFNSQFKAFHLGVDRFRWNSECVGTMYDLVMRKFK